MKTATIETYRGFRIFWDASRQGHYATETVAGRMLRKRTQCFDSGTATESLRALKTWLDGIADAHERLTAARAA